MRHLAGVGYRCPIGPQTPNVPRIHQLLLNNMGDWQMNYWLRISNIACMGVPIEIRSPLLDHRVVEFVFSLPIGFLIRDGWLKWILRKAMSEYLPSEILWRTNKQGFPFPYAQWLNSSRERFFGAIDGNENPYIDFELLRTNYEMLANKEPLILWRLISISLWWKKCVMGESLRT